MKVATIASNDLSFMQKGLQEFFQNSNKMNTELQVITNDMVDTPHNKVSSLEEDEVLVGIKDRVSPHYTFISHKDDVYMWSSPELGTGVSLKNGFHFIGVYKKVTPFLNAIMEQKEEVLPEWIMSMVSKVNWQLERDQRN